MGGTILIILAHGICSSGMFAAANIIYERSHSRSFFFNTGILNRRRIFRIFWFILIVANFGGPFTYNLLGEVINSLLIILRLSFFSAAYSLILYSSTIQGQMSSINTSLISLIKSEIVILFSHV